MTLHDYSTLPAPQRLSTRAFRWTADRIIFTTDFEHDRFGKGSLGNIGARTCTIPIGSNITAHRGDLPRRPRVVYFGQIRPGKGVEDYLALAAECIDSKLPFEFLVAGSAPERHREYLSSVRTNAHPKIDWLVDLPSATISEVLASSLAAYLPFPDGASHRRGSMLAALVNGLPVIAPCGGATSRALADVILPANDRTEAIGHLKRLSSSPEYTKAISAEVRRFGRKFSWADIAREHRSTYDAILGSTRRLTRRHLELTNAK